MRFVFAELFAKLVNDFRHLLALVVMLIFLLSVVYALWIGGTDVDNLTKALQAVTGSLSGIIGVIIGYYFGETAARTGGGTDRLQQGGAPVQGGSPPGPERQVTAGATQPAPSEPMRSAPTPPAD